MSEPYYADDAVTLYAGDCLDILPTLPDNSVDAVCTDPPYGLEFMGKEWDAPWQKGAGTGGHNAGFDQTGFTDGYQRLSRPSYTGSSNPGCLNCGGKRHGRNPEQRKVCTCDEPRFQNVTLPRMVAFGEWCQLWAAECLRVLKPGGHLLAFGGTRTWHRLAVAIEDAGFEIRDSIAWLYGSGFPKSLDVSKAIDRKRDDHQDIVRVTSWLKAQATARGFTRGEIDQHMGTSDMAGWWLTDLPHRCQCPTWEQWETLRRFMGLPDDMDAEVWRLNGRKGTPGEAWDQREQIGEGYRVRRESAVQIVGLSDGAYPITAPATADAQRWQGWGTALKPAHEPIVVARKPLVGTVAANVQRWGTGALNIDGCRVVSAPSPLDGVAGPGSAGFRSEYVGGEKKPGASFPQQGTAGRWPANVTLDETAAAALDHMSGELKSGAWNGVVNAAREDQTSKGAERERVREDRPAGLGGASRFFYTAKAGSDERITYNGISHPTVKSLSLMRWLVRLVTPPGGVILEPFAGSGTTVEAAILEGFRCIAIEREPDYLPLITQRINRRLDPIAYLAAAGEDLGLFDEDAS